MKFKKLAAVLCAAAMAVSAVSALPLFSSAETQYGEPITIYSYDPSTAGVITSAEFTSEAVTAMQSANTSIAVTVDGTGSDGNYFYVMETTEWQNVSGGSTSSPTITITGSTTTNSNNNALTQFKAASGVQVCLSGYTKVNTIKVSIDGGSAITIYDVSTAPAGKVFGGGSDITIAAADLSTYGVTADNIADCKLTATIASVTEGAKQISVIETGNWDNQCYYSDDYAAGDIVIPLTFTEGTNRTNAVANGVYFFAKSIVLSKLTLSVPATENAGAGGTDEGGTTEAASQYLDKNETSMGLDWGASISIDKFNAAEGGKIVITYADDSAGDYHQLKLMDGGWTTLTSPTTNKDGAVELTEGNTSYEIALNEADAAAITEKGLIISGYAVDVASVAYIDSKGTALPTDNSGTETGKKDEDKTLVLWEESPVALASDWGDSVKIEASKFADITKLGTVKVTVDSSATVSGAHWALKDMSDGWPALGEDYTDLATSATYYEYTLTNANLKAVKANGMAVAGHDYTVTKVEYIPGTVDYDPDDDGTGGDPETPETPEAPVVSTAAPVVESGSTSYVAPTTSLTPVTASVTTADAAVQNVNRAKKNATITVKGSAAKTGLTPEIAEALYGKKNVKVKFRTSTSTITVNSADVTSPDAVANLTPKVEITEDGAVIVVDGALEGVDKVKCGIKLSALNGEKVVVKVGGKVIAKKIVTGNYLYINFTPDMVGKTITVVKA